VLPVSIVDVFPFDAGEPSCMGRVLSGLGRGADVMSKAARPKSAAPVSLAGF